MQQWGLVIFISLLWITNLFASQLHWKHYQRTIKRMGSKSKGFLGVGMSRSKFRPRKILMITTDTEGVINECRTLSGITVFNMFKKYNAFEGQHIHSINYTKKSEHWAEALEMATQMIEKEMEKTTNNKEQAIRLVKLNSY